MQSSNTLLHSVQKAIKTFEGAYGLGIISPHYPNTIIATRKGSPLVIGIGKEWQLYCIRPIGTFISHQKIYFS